jgi:uncharacterized membrane protein
VRRPRETGGYLAIGAGAGALADGFLLHQVLQWHHLWSARTPEATLAGLERNILADGIFHVAFLLVVSAGILMLLGHQIRLRPLVSLGLVGWGLFHVVDQLVFHLALGAHHIREGVGNPAIYDWSFFAIGLVLVTLGYAAR